VEYLASAPVRSLLHRTWGRPYRPFAERTRPDLQAILEELVRLRLLERVGRWGPADTTAPVLDAHPLVRRAFEHVLGAAGQRQTAQARAGFLRGRPDRKKPDTLEEAREEVEMFHAYCEAGLWNEADGALVALDNPKHRFLAPALERDLLLRFFPNGDWRQPPLWSGFGRHRSLAICCELLGQFEDALSIYRDGDAALRGDALLALGQLDPLLKQAHAQHPWQILWGAYRSHALCLAGRTDQAVALARSLVPIDVYEWVHVFECLLRAGQLSAIDLKSILFRPPSTVEHRWPDLARRRMRADYVRKSLPNSAPVTEPVDLDREYPQLLDAYDRGGLPYERALTRLSFARWLIDQGRWEEALSVNGITLELARQYGMRIVAADGWSMAAEIAIALSDAAQAGLATQQEKHFRESVGYLGARRP
jgi:tetratricopeptide (TPR) repeat protein